MDIGYYNSYVEIDLGTVRNNMEIVRAHLGSTALMPVVKANAYGTGIAEMGRFYVEEQGATALACAQVVEGVALRNAGLNCDILLMSGLPAGAVETAVEYNLQVALFSKEGAKAVSDAARGRHKTQKCQIKIETGMNRIGVKPGEPLDELVAYIQSLKNLEIVGVFTHFVTAGEGENPFTREQYRLFCSAVDQLKTLPLQYIHCCNTAATEWFSEGYNTHVRVGSLLLGYPDMDDGSNPWGVKQSVSWRAFVTNVHDMEPGESCGYGRHFMAEKKTTVATVSFGYADGFLRPLPQDFGPIYLGETRTRYLGICMDQGFVDATGIDCKVGDEVTIFGDTKGGAHLSPYEFSVYGQGYEGYLCGPNQRVARVYKR